MLVFLLQSSFACPLAHLPLYCANQPSMPTHASVSVRGGPGCTRGSSTETTQATRTVLSERSCASPLRHKWSLRTPSGNGSPPSSPVGGPCCCSQLAAPLLHCFIARLFVVLRWSSLPSACTTPSKHPPSHTHTHPRTLSMHRCRRGCARHSQA